MKVDYEKFPEIPPNCQLNFNKKTELYQVFREYRDPVTKKNIRETIGSIRDGIFRFGENYLLRQQAAKLKKENQALKKQVDRLNKHSQDSQTTADVSKALVEKLENSIRETSFDPRKGQRTSVPMVFIALASIMCALTGKSDAVSIEQYIKTNMNFFKEFFPDFACEVSHDTIRKNFMLIRPKKFDQFFESLITPLLQNQEERIINVDGQAVRASGRRTADRPKIHGTRYVMNIYDSTNRVVLLQRLIGKKKNEISVGFRMISELDLHGCVITADAMSCQVKFVEAVLKAGANYLLSLKGNQDKSLQEVQNIFNTVASNQIEYFVGSSELDHGRIERRTVEIASGPFLSSPLKEKWSGLEEGCVVRITKEVEIKKTREVSQDVAYYISSLSPNEYSAERVGNIARSHWSVENRLHWILDMHWNQDRMQADNPNYISNRSNLNKLALAILENYRFRLWDRGEIKELNSLSIQALQTRTTNPRVATECIYAAIGLPFQAL